MRICTMHSSSKVSSHKFLNYKFNIRASSRVDEKSKHWFWNSFQACDTVVRVDNKSANYWHVKFNVFTSILVEYTRNEVNLKSIWFYTMMTIPVNWTANNGSAYVTQKSFWKFIRSLHTLQSISVNLHPLLSNVILHLFLSSTGINFWILLFI